MHPHPACLLSIARFAMPVFITFRYIFQSNLWLEFGLLQRVALAVIAAVQQLIHLLNRLIVVV